MAKLSTNSSLTVKKRRTILKLRSKLMILLKRTKKWQMFMANVLGKWQEAVFILGECMGKKVSERLLKRNINHKYFVS